MRAVERSVLGSHISWCEPIDAYEGTPTEVVEAILTGYGFGVLVEPDRIEVDGWDGDKLGSCWDEMWDALAPHAADADWIMVGEDGNVWAERIRDHKHTTHHVNMEVKE